MPRLVAFTNTDYTKFIKSEKILKKNNINIHLEKGAHPHFLSHLSSNENRMRFVAFQISSLKKVY